MKKKFFFLLLIVILFPLNASALKIRTEVTGVEEAKPGDSIFYTIIVDQPLNTYKSEIEYDRDVLNLVDVKEVNINTTTKEFNVDKSNPIVIDAKSEELSNIIYTLEFKVKNYTECENTEITIKTLVAKTNEEEFNFEDKIVDLIINNEDDLIDDNEIDVDNKSEISKIINDLGKVLKKYGNTVLYVSLGLNILLIIIVIVNLRRKKVDYDF